MECRHAARCGGCDLIGVSYDDQLARKAARLRERLSAAPQKPVLQAAE